MGFVHPVQSGLVESRDFELDARKNIASDGGGQTSVPGIFVAGDATNGASLVVRAIASGRKAAKAIDEYLRHN